MKKIFIIILSLACLTQAANANWDRVSNVCYKGEAKIKVVGTYDYWNSACPDKVKEKREVDLTDKLNLKNNGFCSYNWWKIVCDWNVSSYQWGFINKNLEFSARAKDIYKWFKKLKWDFILNIDHIKMNIMINQNWMSLWESALFKPREDMVNLEGIYEPDIDTVVYKITLWWLNYNDASECPDTCDKKKWCPPKEDETCEWKDWDCGWKWLTLAAITDKFIPAKVKDFAVNTVKTVAGDNSKKNCIFKDWKYHCFASDTIEFWFETDKPFKEILVSINNEENNAPASENDNIPNGERPYITLPLPWAWIWKNSMQVTFPLFTKAWSWDKEKCYTIVFQWNQRAWDYSTANALVSVKDKYWNPMLDRNGKPIKENPSVKLCIVPQPKDLSWETIDENAIRTTAWKVFANYIDTYKYNFIIKDKYGNAIKDKKINNLVCESGCFLDTTWQHWLQIKNPKLETDSEWKTNFEIISAVPNKYRDGLPEEVKPKFKIDVNDWYSDYTDVVGKNTVFSMVSAASKIFDEPILYDKILVEWDNLNVSKQQKYDLKIKNVWNLTNYSKWKVWTLDTTNITLNDSYQFENNTFISRNEDFWDNVNNWIWFNAVIKALKDEKIKKDIKLKLQNLILNYVLTKEWKNYSISYPLRNLEWKDWCSVDTTWLIINWNAHSKWKDNFTSEINSFSNIPKTDLEKIISKNSADLTRGLKSGEKVNWVLFYDQSKSEEKTLKYSELKDKLIDIDSLIIKNWNLFIDEDVTWNIWIVVLADSYNAETKNDVWNVYVENDVKKIEAYIYAKGWFISADHTWKKYTDYQLRQNKLYLKGSLFSSNTIWWSEKWENTCFLPWWKKTENCELAERYDLNYIRKYIMTCDKDDKENYSFKIDYNQDIQSNAPKVFIVK